MTKKKELPREVFLVVEYGNGTEVIEYNNQKELAEYLEERHDDGVVRKVFRAQQLEVEFKVQLKAPPAYRGKLPTDHCGCAPGTVLCPH